MLAPIEHYELLALLSPEPAMALGGKIRSDQSAFDPLTRALI
jgi:hypothetical protein